MNNDTPERPNDELLEDEEDRRIALARLKDKRATIPLEEVVKQLGLDDDPDP